MKRLLAFAICALVLLTLCASAEDVFGSWAYIHAPEEAAFILKENGTAVLDGEKYNCEIEDGFFVITGKDGKTQRMRYVMDGEQMLLYKTAEYTCQSSNAPKNLVGIWQNDKTHWSYQFTQQGTFLEDGYFPGYYTVNEEDQSFRLVYTDQFADTICYFEITGDQLSVEYPWTMVRIQ